MAGQAEATLQQYNTQHEGGARRDGTSRTIARRVALARRRREVCKTQEVLAEETGVHRTTVGRWESGESIPSLWVRPRIADALHISLDVLVGLLGTDDHVQ